MSECFSKYLGCTNLEASFLEGLAPREVEDVVAAATLRLFPATSVIMSQGQPANRMFLLTKGRGRYFFLTEGGRKLVVHWIMPGEIFGVSALFANHAAYVLGAEMVEDGAVLVWDRESIRRCVAKYPKLLDNTLPIFADYVSRHINMQVAMTHQVARQRLAQVLAILARAIGHLTQGGSELNVTNEELAGMSNVSLFTASRLLSEWQRKGVLSKSRRKIVLRFPEQLFETDI